MYTLCTLVVDTAPVLTYCLGLQITSQSRQSGPESTSYAPPSRGLDRKLSRQGSRNQMGSSQTFGGSTLGRRGEQMDQGGGRDTMSRGGPAPRQPGHHAGSGLPAYGTRPPSRPASSAVGPLTSPRGHNPNNSYRDAAMIAAQHGLGAYGPSAVAAAASRSLTSRSGAGAGGGLNSSHGLGGLPGSLPRQAQHSGHMGHYYAHHQYGQFGGSGAAERLPSRSGPPPSRGGVPPSRSGVPPSRSGPPPPSSPGAYHRTTDAPHGEGPWRGSQDPVLQEGGQPVVLVHPLAMATGPRGVAPAGWGAAAGPSPYEVDGRPGTRGGGPQYDIEGRPTTRGGQRPPSRAQLGLGSGVPPKPPPGGLIPPLGGAGWAGMFAGSLGSKSHGTGVLSSMGPTHGHLSGSGTLTSTGRMVSKLTSIAEAPSSPSMPSPKTPGSRIDSAGGGAGGGGGSFDRKSSRERDLMLSSIPDGAAMDAFLDGISEEGADGIQDSDIDSCLANMDQDSGGNRGKLGSRRSNAGSNASGSNSRQHSSQGGASRGGGAGGALESPTSGRH
eukprot:XP_001702509.1 predicted protein [Chlamydomonas reinhardtii]